MLGGIGPLPRAKAIATLPSGFRDEVAVTGLDYPSNIAFAPDGKVFVTERTGTIQLLDNENDTTPTLVADLSSKVYNGGDRGLLGVAVHPNFPATPYVYVAYSYDGVIGGPFPKWGVAGKLWETCPAAQEATGCVIAGRVSRLTFANGVLGNELVLVEDWCNQFLSHTVGDLAFGADGYLYATGGDGANYLTSDYGQFGNLCGDPPLPAGTNLVLPGAQGGSLRAQSPRRAANVPAVLGGSIVRIDPATGLAAPGNPMAGAADQNRRRIVGHGFRNPFRIAIRPGTNDIYIADVGAGQYEEVDRLVAPADTTVDNFGWPCYEGAPRRPSWDNLDVTSCESLYTAGAAAVVAPLFGYAHSAHVAPGDACPIGSSSVTGLAFYNGTAFPTRYRGGLFVADYARRCIYFLPQGVGGVPDGALAEVFEVEAEGPVDLAVSSTGQLYYPDIVGGTLHRIRYSAGGNGIPTAVATASPTSGPAPLTVSFDGRASADPDGDTLTYAWDLDGDGAFDDSVSATPSRTYNTAGAITAGLQVNDGRGGVDTDQIAISVGNAAPVPTIVSPAVALRWSVGDTVTFTGSATDQEDGTVAAAGLSWVLSIQHCPDTCHEHPVDSWTGESSGSFTAPDHSYPSHLQLTLTATDSAGLSASTTVQLDPKTVTIDLASTPTGAVLDLDETAAPAPRSQTVIAKSTHTVTLASPQTIGGTSYSFSTWSDGGARTHTVVAPASGSVTYTAALTPLVACAAGTFKASYYPNTTSSGSPVLVRCEDRIAADWGDGAPPGVPVAADGFSVRWTGTVTTAAAQYTMWASAADQLRVKIDGVVVIDKLSARPAESFRLDQVLTAGTHSIDVKYGEVSGRAVARFQMMKSLSTACAGWATEFFANVTLSGFATVRRCSADPATSWGGDSPTGVGPDNWSGRFTKAQTFTAGTYTFATNCNDGCRLWLDGVVLIDQWADRAAAQPFTATAAVTAGTHTIYLEMYDRTGPAAISYSATPV